MSSEPIGGGWRDDAGAETLAGVSVRAMKPSDLPRVMEIERASYTMPWTEATFRGLLRRSDAECIAAEAGGRLIGYAAAWFVVDQGELGNVAVDAEWRGRGVGGLLVARVLRIARERGAREVFLEVRPSNAGAQRLYGRFGFREVGKRRNYYSQPLEDALVMRRTFHPERP